MELASIASITVKATPEVVTGGRAGRYTVEEVLASRMIADPLTLLQCCPTGDGALHTLEYGHTGVSVDYCDACFGVWLDAAEFERIGRLG